MANLGEKSITMVQEMVIMLFFSPSLVVTRITGPGSIKVKDLLIGIVFITVHLMLYAKKSIRNGDDSYRFKREERQWKANNPTL